MQKPSKNKLAIQRQSNMQPHDSIILTIIPDEYHIKCVGFLPDGKQVMVTPEILPRPGMPTVDYINTYIWSVDGDFIEGIIVKIGARGEYKDEDAKAVYSNILSNFADLEIDEISVKPFKMEHEGIEFGLIPMTNDGFTCVNLMPGNCISFLEPFDGEYDT
jgi:hypothetical protein